MASALVHYDAARRALADAVRIDDVKQIRDLAVAAQIYARQAQDKELIGNATEIRERAERRAGEVLIEMKDRGERQADHRPKNGSTAQPLPKLADIGISKTQSSRWQRKAEMSPEKFEAHVAVAKGSAVRSLDRAVTQAEKKDRRDTRERELATATEQASVALGSKLYGVIYADPPWRFQPYSTETGMDRAADNHYPTMTLDDIKALGPPAADDAVLFLWATVPMLPQALDLMSAWGFTYKSNFVWVKQTIGSGYWNRNRHELLLIGTRGKVPAPAPGEQFDSVIIVQRSEHSAKPFRAREIIEEMFPTLPRVELFARQRWAGWGSWGNEVKEVDYAD
jgi:N6-adenosine-specific RNA methylase IME4